jgi:hypothetical protein
MNLTREQRVALKKVFDRQQLPAPVPGPDYFGWARYLTYRQFRRLVQPGTFGCIMVPWCNMWLGIERDGYTHS